MCSAMSHKPDPQPSHQPTVRAEVARMQAGRTTLAWVRVLRYPVGA